MANAKADMRETGDRAADGRAAESRAGDETEFRALIEREGDGLFRLCCLYLKDRASAEDALQDACLKAWQGWRAFRGESSRRTWLTRIAINACKSINRGRAALLFAPDKLPERGFEETYADDALLGEVMRLKPKYREVVLLRFYRQLEVAEIALVAGVPESTVYTRLRRALKLLGPRVKKWYFEDE